MIGVARAENADYARSLGCNDVVISDAAVADDLRAKFPNGIDAIAVGVERLSLAGRIGDSTRASERSPPQQNLEPTITWYVTSASAKNRTLDVVIDGSVDSLSFATTSVRCPRVPKYTHRAVLYVLPDVVISTPTVLGIVSEYQTVLPAP